MNLKKEERKQLKQQEKAKKKESKRLNSKELNTDFYLLSKKRSFKIEDSGKLYENNHYTLVPAYKEKHRGIKLILCIFFLVVFISVGIIIMCCAFDYSLWQAVFKFADNYLFVGAITLFVFLVFKKKK